jgi:hypothetical protein
MSMFISLLLALAVCWRTVEAAGPGLDRVASSLRYASSDRDNLHYGNLIQSRRLAALGGVCTTSSDCTGANQACLSLLCECVAGYYESDSTTCSVVPAGSYPSETITYSSTSTGWEGVAASADFRTKVATVENGNIYKSTDSGVSWAALTAAGSKNWRGITCNADCSKIAAVVRNGNIWLSADGGGSWSSLSGAGSKGW